MDTVDNINCVMSGVKDWFIVDLVSVALLLFSFTNTQILGKGLIRCGCARPLARGEPWGYGLGWVYPGL